MDPSLAKALNELAITVVSLITTAFIPWAFSLFRSWAKAKVEAIKNQDTRHALEFALQRLDATAQTVVSELNQTGKTLTADGKLSIEDAKSLKELAFKRVAQRLPEDAIATLKAAYAARLSGLIVGKIESKVAGAK